MSVDLPTQHARHPYFGVSGDHLMIAGRSIVDLAYEIGRTPFYVYARCHMTERVQDLRRMLPTDVQLHYAMKANPMPEIVSHMASLVDGLDVASGGEIKIALRTGLRPDHISFAGPGKTVTELESAVAAGILLNVESRLELTRLAAIAQRSGTRPRVAIRVNPDFELKSSGMKMGGGPRQFGIDAEEVPQLLGEMRSLPVEFVGFHIFGGSQNLRADAIVETQRKTVALAAQLARQAPAPVRVLNIGGGFGIPLFPGERPLDVAPIGASLEALIATVRSTMPQAELVIELGRYLVGEAGIYVCRVLDRKISRGQVFLVTDGGLHHHLAASGNFGQVIRKNYPVLVANKARPEETEIATVVGPLCTPLDLLADRMQMGKAQPGDLIAVLQSGAYGYTASPLGFLSHPPPEQIVT